MEPDIKSAETGAQTPLNTDPSGAITPAGDDAWQDYLGPVSEFLKKLPGSLEKFYAEYKDIIVIVGIVFAAFITVKLTLALLSAINDLPLMAPIFEIIGIGYTVWFVYRYLLRVESRSELSKDLASLKSKIFGSNVAEG
ncbi:MAG: CAAD domain-containing protein [Cyanobacteria bacterium P01_G01_bin.54]